VSAVHFGRLQKTSGLLSGLVILFAILNSSRSIGTVQRLAPAYRSTRSARNFVGRCIVVQVRPRVCSQPLPSALDLEGDIVTSLRARIAILRAGPFLLASGGGKVARLGLSSTSRAGRIMWIVDRAKIAADFSLSTWDACLEIRLDKTGGH
jgi:hypothetical protein